LRERDVAAAERAGEFRQNLTAQVMSRKHHHPCRFGGLHPASSTIAIQAALPNTRRTSQGSRQSMRQSLFNSLQPRRVGVGVVRTRYQVVVSQAMQQLVDAGQRVGRPNSCSIRSRRIGPLYAARPSSDNDERVGLILEQPHLRCSARSALVRIALAIGAR
jgi:hypothetical protein